MYPYIEELIWATNRERLEQARRTRPHTEGRPTSGQNLRSRLARTLVAAGIRLDRSARKSALETPACADC